MIILHRFTSQQALYQHLSTQANSHDQWMVHPYAQKSWHQSTGIENKPITPWIQAWQAHKHLCLQQLENFIEQDSSAEVQKIQAKQQLASQIWALGQTLLSPLQSLAQSHDLWLKRSARWLQGLQNFQPPVDDQQVHKSTFHWVGFWHQPAMLKKWLESLDDQQTHHIWWVNQTREPSWLTSLAPKETQGLSFFPKEVDAYHYDHISDGLDHIQGWLELPQWTPNTALGLVIESPVTRAWLARQPWFHLVDSLQIQPWYQSMASQIAALIQSWVFQVPTLTTWIETFSQCPTQIPDQLHDCLSYLTRMEVIDRSQLEFLSSRQDFPTLAKDWLSLIHAIEKKTTSVNDIHQATDVFMQTWSKPTDTWHNTLSDFFNEGLALFDDQTASYQDWFAWLSEQEILPTKYAYQIGTLDYISHQSINHLVMLDSWVQPLFQLSPSFQSNHSQNTIEARTNQQQIEEILMGFQRQDTSLVYIHAYTKMAPYLLRHPLVDSQPIPFKKNRSSIEQPSMEIFQDAWNRYQNELAENIFSEPEIYLADQGGPLSPSSVQTLATCPRKFYLRHRLGLSVPRTPSLTLRQPPQFFGMMIHDFLHAWFAQENLQHLTHDDFAKLFAFYENKFISRLPHAYKPMWLIEMKQMQEQIWNYVQNQIDLPWKPWQLEFSIQPMVLPQLHPSLLFRGRLDRMDHDGKHLRIIDYKTGAFTKKKNDLWEDGQFVQLPLYTAMIESLYPDYSEVQSEIHHIRTTSIEQACTITAKQWSSEKDSFNDLIHGILAPLDHKQFMPHPGPKMKNCEYCDFQMICGEFRNKTQKATV